MLDRVNRSRTWLVLICLTAMAWTGIANSQVGNQQVPATPWQFDITGFLQEATVTGTGALAGGTLKVNGQVVTVPANTIVILPANALTWAELFTQAPAPYAGTGQSGMALADLPAPLTTYEVHVVGNVVPGATAGQGTYVAGLINIAQQGLNSGAGFITNIDYALGELQVATLGIPAVTRVRINDPLGRYGRINSPDPRFTVDPDNPTIQAGTGFPMCLPRVAPVAGGGDPLCPEGNRLQVLLPGGGTAYLGSFDMPDPALVGPGALPDPRIQVPFEVGDYITFAGTLVSDTTGTAGPWPGTAGTYISAHTIVNNLAVYTAPGTNPAYVSTEVTIIGTGGLTVLGAGEAAVRTRFEGMMTDPSRLVHLYGMDLTTAGLESDRDWGTVGVDPGPPLGAVKGRWRFRPPCTATTTTISDKKCSPPPAGVFLPPTREVRAVIEGYPGTTQVAAWTAGAPACAPGVVGVCNTTAANGIIAGQYHAPILEYIFPENIPGTPMVPNNFEALTFLACGGYTSSAGTLAGQLTPWPGAVAPSLASCPGAILPPTVTAAASPNPAPAGALVTLTATVGGAGTTVAWTQNPLDVPQVVLSGAGTAIATFTAPLSATATTLNFTVMATNGGGSVSANVSVVIDAVGAPTVSYAPANPVFNWPSGTPLSITATGVDPSNLPVSVSWTQVNSGAAGVPTVVTPNPLVCAQAASPATCTLNFTVTIPVGAPAVTIQLAAQATNSLGVASAQDFTSVTIVPPADTVTITSAEYRTSKQRLIVNATSSVISPSVVLTLAPYATSTITGVPTGQIYDPCAVGASGCTFTNNGGGLYIIDVVGAPPPVCKNTGPYATPCTLPVMVVKSSLGGTSPASVLTRIRQ